MKNKIKLFAVVIIALSGKLFAQVLYAPAPGVSGIQTSANSLTGIGTSSPRGQLELFPLCSTGGTVPTLLISRPGSMACAFGKNLGNYLEIREYNGFNTSYTLPFIVTRLGRIGIGMATTTMAPAENLHLHNGAMRITGQNQNGGPMVLFGGAVDGNTSGAPSGQWGIEYVKDANPALCGMNFWRPNFAHNISGAGAGMQNNVLFLRNDNHIGIMTNKPTANLTVNGNALVGDPDVVTSLPSGYRLYVQDGILTEKVKVALHNDPVNWSDYVFAPDYKLNSTEYVANYIKENKHLPNVPSTSEVIANGIDLAKMDATLLRQIEELWLHVIELKKENEELKSIIKKQ